MNRPLTSSRRQRLGAAEGEPDVLHDSWTAPDVPQAYDDHELLREDAEPREVSVAAVATSTPAGITDGMIHGMSSAAAASTAWSTLARVDRASLQVSAANARVPTPTTSSPRLICPESSMSIPPRSTLANTGGG